MTFSMGPAILFCPADRPERFTKAAERADAVILDLEDAVGADAKAAAREHVIAAELDPARTIVRINAVDAGHLSADLAAVLDSPFRTVMLAKTESASDVDTVVDRAEALSIVALCETARGVHYAGEIAAHPFVTALMWGAEDLVASMGGSASRFANGTYRDVARLARASVLLAAKAHGKGAIDAIYANIADIDGVAIEAEDACASGFDAKAAIHPSHSAPIRAAFAPTEAEIDWARRVLAAAAEHPGVFRFDGQMVDEPILKHARGLQRRAAAADHPRNGVSQ